LVSLENRIHRTGPFPLRDVTATARGVMAAMFRFGFCPAAQLTANGADYSGNCIMETPRVTFK